VLADSLDQVHGIAASHGLVASYHPHLSTRRTSGSTGWSSSRWAGSRWTLADILAAVDEVGYDSWLLVELDSYDGDPLEAAKISKVYLEQVLDKLS
jgi:inosose dehydratase